jgi:hypothetical protein
MHPSITRARRITTTAKAPTATVTYPHKPALDTAAIIAEWAPFAAAHTAKKQADKKLIADAHALAAELRAKRNGK